MSRRWSVLSLAVPVLLIAGCNSASVGPSADTLLADTPSPATSASPASPELSSSPPPAAASSKPVSVSASIEPANFTSTVDNPWFPLMPGTRFTYRGTKDGKSAVETFTVARGTKVIDAVTCVVVEDKVSLGGVATEKLIGYYAQDRDGNVWYFGEDMQELDANGHVVNTDGSWHAGVDKARPAFFMEATPTVGHSYAHAYTNNDFAVLSLSEKVTVPFGSFPDALVTKEWSPLEPDVETHKFYVRGVGVVRDVAVKGPTEELLLVKVEAAAP